MMRALSVTMIGVVSLLAGAQPAAAQFGPNLRTGELRGCSQLYDPSWCATVTWQIWLNGPPEAPINSTYMFLTSTGGQPGVNCGASPLCSTTVYQNGSVLATFRNFGVPRNAPASLYFSFLPDSGTAFVRWNIGLVGDPVSEAVPVTAVPEPSTLALIAGGVAAVAALGVWRRRA